MTSDPTNGERTAAGPAPTGVHGPPRQWEGPAQLRQRAERRRARRRLTGATGTVAVLVAAAVLVATLPSSPGGGVRVRTVDHIGDAVEVAAVTNRTAPATGGTAARTAASGEQQFSQRLLATLVRQTPSANHLVAPYSLAEVLLMLELGARGQTASQIASVLGAGSTSGADQAAGWRALAADLQKATGSGHVTFHDASSLWTRNEAGIRPQYLAALQQAFGAGVWQADFAHDPTGTADAINAWVRAETGGRITKLLDPSDIDASTILTLLDAVTFVGTWEQPFGTTSPGTFQAPGGARTVTYLQDSSGAPRHVPALFGNGVVAVQLPYGDPGTSGSSATAPVPSASRYAALVVMPTSSSLPAWLSSLSPGGLASLVGRMTTQPVTVSMPQLSLSSRQSLNRTLSTMGMPDAFGPTADFGGISPLAPRVGFVLQAAMLHVTRTGTVAAAATAAGLESAAAYVSRHATFDRPYLFAVRDTVTGAILFEAAVENPAA